MKISIVIPLYNKEKHIRDTLKCIFEQTYQDFEIIIVNDGSSDRSLEIVSTVKDARIRVISQENKGAAAARNKGVEIASSDYVAFMDADDRWKKNYLESMIDLIRSYPDAAIYGSNYEIWENGKVSVLEYPEIIEDKSIIKNYFISGKVYTPLWTSAVIVKRNIFLNLGGFPVRSKVCEDVDLWCRMALSGQIAYLNKPLAIYKRDSSNMLSKSQNASCYFPFLDNYKQFIDSSDKKFEEVEEYIVYRKLVAASYALFSVKNKKEAKKILKKIPIQRGIYKKKVVYKLFSYAPFFLIDLYCTMRSVIQKRGRLC